MKAPSSAMASSFVDTPKGIFTASGTWFRTTEALLEEYAGALIEHVSVERLMTIAERWLRSPGTLVLWLAPPLLGMLGIAPAILILAGVYLLLAIWGPVFVNWWVQPLLGLLDHVLFQAIYYVVALSIFSLTEDFGLMGIGLALFILVRWGLVARLAEPLLKRLHRSLYAVPYADQILKSVIVRAAMKHRVSLPEIDRIERSILNQLQRK